MLNVETYLQDKLRNDGPLHMTLLDPEKVDPSTIGQLANRTEKAGTAAIMVGGSTVASSRDLDIVIQAIKKSVKVPTILFPNNISGISPHADAIWFMSLINSNNPYFLMGAQALGAPLVKKYKLETMPMGYIIVGSGGAAGLIGRANGISYDKPEIAAIYALAAQYLGMRFVYLEAGSGAQQPVPLPMVSAVREAIDCTLIVGGGIKSGEVAGELAKAGADIIVTGTLVEESQGNTDKIRDIVETLSQTK
ncbi:geranylgeranylglyceryl/heptaprenylglyceryl phosphate synthase [Candidatus Bathyarchaeota archaeon]|nr:geranylgeranylglyceryl/heptaprenylglyceryl phosphate synthase [Candidatus Bathyarchaeota archaeon]